MQAFEVIEVEAEDPAEIRYSKIGYNNTNKCSAVVNVMGISGQKFNWLSRGAAVACVSEYQLVRVAALYGG